MAPDTVTGPRPICNCTIPRLAAAWRAHWPAGAAPGILLAMPMDAFLARCASHLASRPAAQALYTDLDNTLLGPDGALLRAPDGEPSSRAARALVDAADGGIAVVPVSGRQRHQLQQDARLLGLRDCIGEAGAVTVRDGRAHYAWGSCPRDLAATPHDALAAAGALDVLLSAFPDDLRLYEPWHRGREGGMLLHGQVDVAAANALLAEAGLSWAALVDNGATGGWPGRAVRAYHLLPDGVGKARAVADDLSSRGLDPAAAAAIGDSPEDATMAAVVGTYFQVANGASPSDARVLVTPSAMGHGFSEAVTALLAAREVRQA